VVTGPEDLPTRHAELKAKTAAHVARLEGNMEVPPVVGARAESKRPGPSHLRVASGQ
jgi:hypothetical protein